MCVENRRAVLFSPVNAPDRVTTAQARAYPSTSGELNVILIFFFIFRLLSVDADVALYQIPVCVVTIHFGAETAMMLPSR